MKKIVTIEGMSCGHCVMHVTNALKEVPGVSRVNVDLEKSRADVEGDALDETALKNAVTEAGYEPVAVETV